MKKLVVLLITLLFILMLTSCSEIVRVDTLESLMELTGRDYIDVEIVDIKTVLVEDVYGTGT